MSLASDQDFDQQLLTSSRNFVLQLFMMLKTATLYDSNNAAFTHSLEALAKEMKPIIDRLGSLHLEIIEDNLFINEEKIKSDLYSYSAFQFLLSEFAQKKIGGLQLSGMPSNEELKNFVAHFARFKADGEKGHVALNELLNQHGVQFAQAMEPRNRQIAAVDEQTVSTNKASALRNYVRAVELMKDAVGRLDGHKGLDVSKSKRIVYNLVNHSFDEGYAFVSLASIKNFDVYTYNHCVNVCILSISFGQNLGLSKPQLTDLGIGALYHDVGKLNIPKEILNKPTGFTDEEWRIMKQHPVLAIRQLLPLRGASDADVKKAIPALEHHRDFDLSGYPPTIIRKPLNFNSKVVAICDAFDAMTSGRVYQKGLLPTQALQIILKGAGKKFDPVLVKAFINTMGLYPVGSLLELNNGMLGVVSEINKDPSKGERPKLVIIMDKTGRQCAPTPIDLDEPKFGLLSVVKAINPEDYKVNVAHYLLGS